MDITSFTRLGTVFSSVMTGNLVLLGLAVERASGELASHTAPAFAGYILGVALGSLMCREAAMGGDSWREQVFRLSRLRGFPGAAGISGSFVRTCAGCFVALPANGRAG
jgi:uncharacterized membrane protein YoaK (UPF0700 family)